jgi:hypothetical protein
VVRTDSFVSEADAALVRVHRFIHPASVAQEDAMDETQSRVRRVVGHEPLAAGKRLRPALVGERVGEICGKAFEGVTFLDLCPPAVPPHHLDSRYQPQRQEPIMRGRKTLVTHIEVVCSRRCPVTNGRVYTEGNESLRPRTGGETDERV